MELIDLRSDTVTRPSPEMRKAMAEAEVGDEQYGDDPTVLRLERMSAEMLGMEAAMFVASGTMANLVAIRVHTHHGDSVLVGETAHSWLYEAGGPAAVAGVQLVVIGRGGSFTKEQVEAACLGGNIHFPSTRLIMLENTHNRGGGIIFPQKDIEDVTSFARVWGLNTHLDGARIFNAAVAQGIDAKDISRHFDSVCYCLSKGLGAPVGSILLGSSEFMERARYIRQMLGGAMRQVGILAAAGIYALENNIQRLAEDHENARWLAERLIEMDGIEFDLSTVQTNMIIFRVNRPGLNAPEYAARLKELGVLVNFISKDHIRVVTHLDVNRKMVEKAADIFAKAL
jgi:threonine aldolase